MIVKPIRNLSAALEKEHGVSFLTARMVDTVKDMVSSELLTSNSPQIYQCYIKVAKFLLQPHNILNIVENTDGEETDSRTLGIPHIDGGTLSSSWTRKRLLLARAVSEYA